MAKNVKPTDFLLSKNEGNPFCFESSSKGGKAVSKEEKQRHGFVLDEGEEYSEGEGSKRQRRLLEVFLRLLPEVVSRIFLCG